MARGNTKKWKEDGCWVLPRFGRGGCGGRWKFFEGEKKGEEKYTEMVFYPDRRGEEVNLHFVGGLRGGNVDRGSGVYGRKRLALPRF